MQASIEAGDDSGCGLEVVDNQTVEHWIEIKYDPGEISYHEQDGYPDHPTNRTPDENEHVSQARRYARYYVFQETNHNPFPPEKNLLEIEKTKRVIEERSLEQFESWFGNAYEQVLAFHPNIEPPVELPPSVSNGDYVLYLVDVYLDENDDIEAVSDIHLQYLDQTGEKVHEWNDDPFPNRKPDARLQLFGKYVPSMDVFREFVVYHLRCQLRDMYLGAGIEPPEEYRVLGRGNDELTGRYSNPEITVYEDYHLEEADIPGYDFEFDYGFGERGKQSVIDAKRAGIDGKTDGDIDPELSDPSGEDDSGLLESVSSLVNSEEATENTE